MIIFFSRLLCKFLHVLSLCKIPKQEVLFIMTKQEITAKVNALIEAPSCNPALKAAAEEYLKSQDKESAAKLVKAL